MWKRLALQGMVLLLYIGFFTVELKAESYPCKAVKLLAMVYADNALAVTELHDGEKQECIYSINGATASDASSITLDGIKKSLGSLGYLLNYARGTLPVGEDKKFKEVISRLPEHIIYLVSAPRLVKGQPLPYLYELIGTNSKMIKDCFTEFYEGKLTAGLPSINGHNASCYVPEKTKHMMRIQFQQEKFIHVLHTIK